jgi:uncharacterized protein (TIGR02246 family)
MRVIALVMLLAIAFEIPVPCQTGDMVAVIQKSAADWNTGSLEAYMDCYEKSPETTFVGTAVTRGTGDVLARYRKAYPSRERMGHLTFTELAARPLSADIAIVTGRYTLERPAENGGKRSGLFTVVMRKGDRGWRIIHDHSN